MRTPSAAGSSAVTVDVVDARTGTARTLPVDVVGAGTRTAPGATGGASSVAARRRRIAGSVVLLLALACVFSLNRLSGDRVAGRPVADWPQPPAPGSCVDTAAGFRVVPCAGPHDAEVTAAHDALDPIVTDTARRPMYDACDLAVAEYLGPGADGGPVPGVAGWDTVGLWYATEPVTAPPDQRAGRYAWQVCLIHPAVPARYTGTVRGASARGAISAPPAYRLCLAADGAPADCAGPHTSEVLALRTPVPAPAAPSRPGERSGVAAPPAREALQRQCTAVAGRILSTADPTYGGRVTVDARPAGGAEPTLSGPVWVSVPDGSLLVQHNAVATLVTVDYCVVTAPTGRQLTGSLVGRGDRPPPLAGG